MSRLGLQDYVLEAAFGQSFWDGRDHWDDCVWTDLSGRMRDNPGLEIKRGRSDVRASFEVGDMRVTLDTNDRALDRDYTDSPYAGLLEEDTLIRARRVVGDDATGRFFGFSGAWRLELSESGLDILCPLHAWDALKHLRMTRISSYLPRESSGERIWRLLTLAGFPPERPDFPFWRIAIGSMGERTMQPVYMREQSILEQIELARRSEGPQSRFWINRDGAAVFLPAHAVWWDAELSTVQATFGNTPGALPCRNPVMPDVERERFNQVRVSIVSADRSPSMPLYLAAAASGLDGSIIVIPPITQPLTVGTEIDFGSARVVRVRVAAEPPSAPQELQVIFTDPLPADLPEGAQAVHDPNVVILADNDDQALHGKRENGDYQNLLLETLAEAAAMGAAMLRTGTATASRFGSLDLDGNTDDDVSEQMLLRGIGDRIAASFIPPAGGDPIAKAMIVEGLENRVRLWNETMMLSFSPAPPDLAFWRLGITDQLGIDTDLNN